MKFAIVLLACIVAAQAQYGGGRQGYGGQTGGYGGRTGGYGGQTGQRGGLSGYGGRTGGYGGQTGQRSGLSGYGRQTGGYGGQTGQRSGLSGYGRQTGYGGQTAQRTPQTGYGGQTARRTPTGQYGAIYQPPQQQTSANKWAVPAYQYWACHQFHVLPPKSLYCYQVQFNRAWCTAQFYHDCLVEYPKCLDDKSCEAERTDLDVMVGEITQKLAHARQVIVQGMSQHLIQFTTRIDQVHVQWLSALKMYLSRCYSANSYAYCQRIQSYTNELNTARAHAIQVFHQSVHASCHKIEVFHAKLIQSFQACLQKRIQSLAQYNHQIEHRAEQCMVHYRQTLQAVMTKKVHFITHVFDKLYTGKTKPEQLADFIAQYQTELQAKMEAAIAEFKPLIEQGLVQVKESYRCCYKCVFRSGCYTFSRKSYAKKCVRLPTPPHPDCKLISCSQFCVDWKGCDVSMLKTMTDEPCVFTEEVHIAAINAKVIQFKAELAARIAVWKTQVIGWEAKATAGLEAKVATLIPATLGDIKPSPQEIEACRQAATIRAKNFVHHYKKELLKQIEAAEKKLLGQIEAWKVSALAFVTKVKAQFDACVAGRAAKIASYTELIESTKVSQRAALVAKLNHLRATHKTQFEKFWQCAFGDATDEAGLTDGIKTSYFEMIEIRIKEVMEKFEAWWVKYQPKIIEHHTCGLKCKTKVHIPHLRMCFDWRLCAPSIKKCKFYC